jgi:hypothetical protein
MSATPVGVLLFIDYHCGEKYANSSWMQRCRNFTSELQRLGFVGSQRQDFQVLYLSEILTGYNSHTWPNISRH